MKKTAEYPVKILCSVFLALWLALWAGSLTGYAATAKPEKTSITSVASAKAKTMTVKIKAVKGCSGYQIQISPKSKFSSAKSYLTGNTSKTISNLVGGTQYYVRVRTYVSSGKKKVYGSWSASKSIVVMEGPVRYKITYKLNGGKNNAKNVASYLNTASKATPLYKATRTGYQFGGWYRDKSFQTRVRSIPGGSNKNVTVYAKWIPNTYKISYRVNRKDSPLRNYDQSDLTYGTSYTLEKNRYSYYINDYTFKGWNTKADGTGTSYKEGAKIKNLTSKEDGTVILYAQWEPILEDPTMVPMTVDGKTTETGGDWQGRVTMLKKSFSLPRGSYMYFNIAPANSELKSVKSSNEKSFYVYLSGGMVYGWATTNGVSTVTFTFQNGAMYSYRITVTDPLAKYTYNDEAEAWVKKNITSSMTDMQKVQKLMDYIAYGSYGYNGYQEYADTIVGSRMMREYCMEMNIPVQEWYCNDSTLTAYQIYKGFQYCYVWLGGKRYICKAAYNAKPVLEPK